MTEVEEAKVIANKVLDRVNADPDDDIAVLARQCLRQSEQIGRLYKVCNERDALRNTLKNMLAALKGVVRVADRKTVEFDAAHAAIAEAELVSIDE